MRGKFIAYYRVSTDKQGQSGLGLDAQRRAVADYLDGGNWTLIEEFTEVESGKHSSRPQLAAALKACKQHRARLVIAKLDRLSRNVAFIAALMESKVEFICCDMPAANKTMLHFMAVMAEAERDAISDRTRKALAAAKARGKPLGLLAHRDGGAKLKAAKRAAADARAEAVRPHITATRDLSAQSAADDLNRRGITTASGKRWHAMQVHRMRARLGL